MKSKVQFYTGAIVLIAGVLLLIFSSNISSTDVVITGGILFIVAGVLDIFASLNEKKKAEPGKGTSFLVIFNWIVSVSAIILGLCMIFMKENFTQFVPYVFAVLCLFGSLMLFYILAIGLRPVMLSGWLYLLPIAILVMSIFTAMSNSANDDSRIMILTGVSAILFAICAFAIGFGLVKYHKGVALEADTKADEKESKKEPLKPVGIDEGDKK